MKLPFTVEEFLQIFRAYNQWIYPLQFVFYILAFVIVYISIKKPANGNRLINFILAFFWLWMGFVYHLMFFSAINKAAYIFGILFIFQGALFIYYGVIRQKLKYNLTNDPTNWIGMVLVVFALLIYPVLGYLFKHAYPASPTFGVPCPTTIFTFGVLLWSKEKVPIVLLIIPFLWSLLGFSASTSLGIKEDMALVIAGILAVSILLFRREPVKKILAG